MSTPMEAEQLTQQSGQRLIRGTVGAHLRVPLYREGYALVLNQALTSMLGIVYWVLAAHHFSPQVVGVNSAAISAMMFLAGVSQLNLMSAVVRFIPVMGRRSTRLVVSSYGLAVAVAAVAALVFLAGIELWAPALEYLSSTPWFTVWFIAATMAWCIFNLQDSVLVGLRAAVFVPLENFVYSLAKIALLVAAAAASWHHGIFASWTAGLTASLVAVNLFIFTRLLPRHVELNSGRSTAPTRREIARFVSADFLGSFFWLGATALMPLIVIQIAGAAENAYFSVAWMIALPIFAISSATGQSLVVSGSHDEAALPAYARRVLVQTASIVAPVALALAVAAAPVLSVFGTEYAHHSDTTLALLALAGIPHVVTFVYLSAYRVRRRMSRVVAVLGCLCGLAVVLGVGLLHVLGIAGVGLGWLIAESVVAATLLVIDRHTLWPVH